MASRYPHRTSRTPLVSFGEAIPVNHGSDGLFRPRSPAQIRSPRVHGAIPTCVELVPTPPNIDTTPVFRITGIPLSATQHEVLSVLMSELDLEEDILPNASRLACWVSCCDRRTQAALLEFTPRAPSLLLDYLNDKSNKGYMISFPGGGEITIDQDFYGLTQLYPTSHPIKADIVAVGGLDEHAYWTWSGKADNRGIRRMWLREFLNEDLPSCRTMIYGYDTRLRGAHGLREVPDYTDMFLEELRKARRAPEEKNRPIIFIGHSFGGVLIAEAIVKAKANIDKYGALFDSTKATIFYSVPNQSQVVQDILGMVGDDSTREHLVKSLRWRSEGELHGFINCVSPYGMKIINYKETHQNQRLIRGDNGELPREGNLHNTAGEEIAVLHLPESISDTLMIDGDHSTLVKFQYKAQLSYTSVLMQLEECTNDTGVDRYKALEIAIKNGTYLDLVRALQTRVVDLNSPLKHLEGSPTLLHLATSANDLRKVELLLEKGANIEARDASGSTALHQAITSKNVKLVELLLQNGGKNDLQGYCRGNDWMYKMPLLHFACAEGNSEIVETLVKTGDATFEDCAGDRDYRPIHFAALNKDSSVLEMLIVKKKVDIEAHSSRGRRALQLAAEGGLERNIRLLVHHGAMIDAFDYEHVSALQSAIDSQKATVVGVLLDSGADIAGGDNNGNSLFHRACAGSNEEIVQMFLDRKADIECRGPGGMTPLLYAAKHGSKSIFELLVRNEADVTAAGPLKQTLLHMAVVNMNEDFAELILSHGANIEARDSNQMTPLLRAARGSSRSTFELLLQNKADITVVGLRRQTVLHMAAGNRNEDLVELVLGHGADTDARDCDGMSPLHYAVILNNGPVAKSLLKHGASTASKDITGETPLHVAIDRSRDNLIEILLNHNADVDARNNLEETPLHIAARNRNAKIVKFLLEHQADTKARNLDFMQPLGLAIRADDAACVKLLKEGGPRNDGRA